MAHPGPFIAESDLLAWESMHLTRFTDYGLRTLIYLAVQPDKRRVTIKEVVEVYGLSRDHVVKVVHRLGKLGYVETFRGKSGGFRLAHAPEEINVGAVVEQLEPSFNMAECGNPVCRLSPSCRLQGILKEATTEFKSVLRRYTLTDLITHEGKVKRLLGV